MFRFTFRTNPHVHKNPLKCLCPQIQLGKTKKYIYIYRYVCEVGCMLDIAAWP